MKQIKKIKTALKRKSVKTPSPKEKKFLKDIHQARIDNAKRYLLGRNLKHSDLMSGARKTHGLVRGWTKVFGGNRAEINKKAKALVKVSKKK